MSKRKRVTVTVDVEFSVPIPHLLLRMMIWGARKTFEKEKTKILADLAAGTGPVTLTDIVLQGIQVEDLGESHGQQNDDSGEPRRIGAPDGSV